MKRILTHLFFLTLFCSAKAEVANWKTLEDLTQQNNNRIIVGEVIHNYKGMNYEEATLEIQSPNFIELKLKSGFLLLRVEPGIVKTGNPSDRPVLAKAWELYVTAQRGIASLTGNDNSLFFESYKNSEYFQITSLYSDPFHQVEISAEEQKLIPFKKLSMYFDSKNRFQQARVTFKNGLYANFTATAHKKAAKLNEAEYK